MLATQAMFISRRTMRDTRRGGSIMRYWRGMNRFMDRFSDRSGLSAYWTYSVREMARESERKSSEIKTFMAIEADRS